MQSGVARLLHTRSYSAIDKRQRERIAAAQDAAQRDTNRPVGRSPSGAPAAVVTATR